MDEKELNEGLDSDDDISLISGGDSRKKKDLSQYVRKEGNGEDSDVEEVKSEPDEVSEAQEYAPLEEDEDFGDFHGFDSEPAASTLLSSGNRAQHSLENVEEAGVQDALPPAYIPSERRGIPPLSKGIMICFLYYP